MGVRAPAGRRPPRTPTPRWMWSAIRDAGRALPWLSPREWLRRRRRCRSHSPGRRLGAGTPSGLVTPARQAPARGRAGQPGTRRQREQRSRPPRAAATGWAIPAQRQRVAQRREPDQDRLPGRRPRSTAGPTGLSPGTTRRGSIRRTPAGLGPGRSARRRRRRPSARWEPGPTRAAWDVPCVHGTQNGRRRRYRLSPTVPVRVNLAPVRRVQQLTQCSRQPHTAVRTKRYR